MSAVAHRALHLLPPSPGQLPLSSAPLAPATLAAWPGHQQARPWLQLLPLPAVLFSRFVNTTNFTSPLRSTFSILIKAATCPPRAPDLPHPALLSSRTLSPPNILQLSCPIRDRTRETWVL